MTKKEILNTPEIVDFMLDKSVIVDSKIKLHKRLEELCKLAIKALEQELVFDKIRDEIEEIQIIGYATVDGKLDIASRAVMRIIDKYKRESEDKISKIKSEYLVMDEYGYTDKELVDTVNMLVDKVNELNAQVQHRK